MEKKNIKVITFFTILFKNLPKLILTNLLFSVPLAIFAVLFTYLGTLVPDASFFIMLLPIIFVMPFYSGVTLVTRDLVKGVEIKSVVGLFFKGIKESVKQFAIHGLVLYFAVIACYFSIKLYWMLAQTYGFFYVPMVLVSFIAIFLLFAFYYIPVMTVTLDLPLKNIYKNSFLFSFGELKNNFFASLGLFLLFIMGATLFLSVGWLLLVFIALLAPVLISFIINFYIYKGMMDLIENKIARSQELQEKIKAEEDKRRKKQIADKLDFSALDLDENKDMEEYLYFNGKMLKRRVLIDMRDKQEFSNE